MNVKVLNTDDEFASLEQEWESLLKQDDLSNNFMSFYWVHSWWKAYRPDARLFIITVKNDDSELVGIAPLMELNFTDGGFSYTRLDFIGDGTNETNHMSFILNKAYLVDSIHCILQAIQDNPYWDVLALTSIQNRAALRDMLRSWALRNKFYINQQEVEYAENKLPASYEQFIGKLQPRFRTKLRSTTSKLEGKYDVEFGLHSSEDQKADLITLFNNHESRWNGKGEDGAFKRNPRRVEFYRLLTLNFFREDWLRFFFLKLDGSIVAQQYCFEYKGTIYLLQEGFDFEYAQENVGNILRGYVFEYCIENKVVVYDFLANVNRHKRIWSNNIKKDESINIFRRNSKTSVYLLKRYLIQNSKTFLKSVLPPSAVAYLKKIV